MKYKITYIQQRNQVAGFHQLNATNNTLQKSNIPHPTSKK